MILTHGQIIMKYCSTYKYFYVSNNVIFEVKINYKKKFL